MTTESETPKAGHIVRHRFLWAREHALGQDEGTKVRPCIVIAVEPDQSVRAPRVTVLPVTSQPPRSGTTAVAIPDALKTRLGLDSTRPGWVMIDDANVFTWPGFDLVPAPDGGFIHGTITSGFFRQVAAAVLSVHSQGKLRRTDRD